MQRLLFAWWSFAQYGMTPPRTRRNTSAAQSIPNVGAINKSRSRASTRREMLNRVFVRGSYSAPDSGVSNKMNIAFSAPTKYAAYRASFLLLVTNRTVIINTKEGCECASKKRVQAHLARFHQIFLPVVERAQRTKSAWPREGVCLLKACLSDRSALNQLVHGYISFEEWLQAPFWCGADSAMLVPRRWWPKRELMLRLRKNLFTPAVGKGLMRDATTRVENSVAVT